jgi:hypothetical protein
MCLLLAITKIYHISSSVDEVITNGVPVDTNTFLGADVQSSEIKRILKIGGRWIHNVVKQR